VGALRCQGLREMVIGVYPALLSLDAASSLHPVEADGGIRRVLLPDYLVEHDLPSAYQRSVEAVSSSSSVSHSSTSVSLTGSSIIELPVRDIRGGNEVGTPVAVRLRSTVDPGMGAFAVRVPMPGLTSTGFAGGKWLVVRPTRPEDLGSDAWHIALRSQGTFGATAADWTIAHAKELSSTDEEPTRLQVSYGSATDKKFRPERLNRSETLLVATVVCHAEEAP
jgi:hypothetical protein